MRKGSFALVLLTIVLTVVLVGCGKSKAEQTVPPALADGTYFALEDTYDDNGWKSTITITVSGGAISAIDWNGASVNGGLDKKSYDKAGNYNMVKYGNAIAEWYEQAQRAEQFLLNNPDQLNAAKIDAISGVSIEVEPMFALARKALAAGPVGKGPYADGPYWASEEDFDEAGWKGNISMTVINGTIAAVNWNGVNANGENKKEYDKAGKYNMVKFGNAIAEWYQQAQKVEEYLIKTQDPAAIAYKDSEGHTDAISGATISVDGFFNLASKALANGPTQQ